MHTANNYASSRPIEEITSLIAHAIVSTDHTVAEIHLFLDLWLWPPGRLTFN
jgi:hypothetical protein